MELNAKEKQLLWRGLCCSEELESDRISYHKNPKNDNDRFSRKAKDKMIITGDDRLKEIKKLKDRLWSEMT